MKKILFVMLMLAPMSIFAQKFAHFNMADVLPEMAEYKAASADIQKLTTQYQEELERLQKEYQAKAEEFQKLSADANAAQAILQSKGQDLQKMEQSIQDFYQASQQDLQKQQSEKMEPILVKINTAIKKIGESGAYVYVVDISAGAIQFINEALSTDITAQLKTELGIK
ncbi:MAG: OmpH family outer membrane protein [Bacteroidaceae bacterium]|nr:OmpH family outer membrane protein [Bacteroidaceae bacterium]